MGGWVSPRARPLSSGHEHRPTYRPEIGDARIAAVHGVWDASVSWGASCAVWAARTVGLTARAVRTPASDRAAAAWRAGRRPAVKLAGVAMWPLAVNTVVAIATPKALPKRCRVLLMPDALPRSAGGTALRTAAGATGRAMEIPVPAMTSGAMKDG